jgi:hypothetical protein
MKRSVGSASVSQPAGADYGFGEVLPEQTADDLAEPNDEGDGVDADVQRLLDDKPPHHLD